MSSLVNGNIDLSQVNIIFHADDIGMNQSSITAFSQLCKNNKWLSGSIMAPCPWFSSAIKLQQQLPQADLGLHLTLTSEWDDYRWGPVSQTKTSDGLVDESGVYFHKKTAQVCQQASVDAVEKELTAQIELAKRMGFEPTHLDGHMFASHQPKFLPSLLQLSLQYQIPAAVSLTHLNALGDNQAQYWIEKLKSAGAPVFNQIGRIHLTAGNHNKAEQIKDFFSQLSPGLHDIYFHPAKPCSALNAMTSQANDRIDEFELLLNFDLAEMAQAQDINVCTFKDLQFFT
ncbi:MAG: ChbG/HpnK family deacetylase [Algicola sp.]|nr:ChbG/HpnK family deacetylase [Algicola sp.]